MVEVADSVIELIIQEYSHTNKKIEHQRQMMDKCIDARELVTISKDYNRLIGKLLGIQFTIQTLNLITTPEKLPAEAICTEV